MAKMTNEMKIKKALESIKGNYSLKDRASAMRKLFKDLYGFNNRKLSIKCSRGGAINIEILDSDIKLNQIKDIAEQFEQVYYDKMSGEILSGGNIFVFVDYSRDIKNNLWKSLREFAESINNSAEPEGNNYRINSELKLFYSPKYRHFTIFDNYGSDVFSAPANDLTGAFINLILYEKLVSLNDILNLKKI